MSEMPVTHQTPINKRRRKQIGPAKADSRGPGGGQSLEAGGEFLKAAKHRRPQQPPAPAPSRSGSGVGRALWRVSMVLLGVVLLCSGALSAAMLWVIFGSPLEPRHSAPDTPGLRAEAASNASLSRGSTGNAAKPSQPGTGPVAEAPIPPGPSPAGAVQQEKPAEQTKVDAQTGSNQPQPGRTPTQDRGPGTGPEQNSGTLTDQRPEETQNRGPGASKPENAAALTDQRPGMQCSVDLCAATYKSFNAADCTYQPYGGGPRSICQLSAQPAIARSQTARVTTDPSPKTPATQPAATVLPIAQSVAPDGAGPQCDRALCSATYRSFNAADCTYAPLGGGPRSLCELSKGPADAPQQTLRAATDPRDSAADANDMPAPGMAPAGMVPAGIVQDTAEPATPDWGGPQCNRSRCAATYQSFHAADCTYQPEGGGPRRICGP